MLDEVASTPPEAQPLGERPSASLLVRCWLEPRATPDEPPILRGYVKNLKTGEETYIKDFDAVGLQIRRTLIHDAEEIAPSTPSRAPQSADR